MIKEEMGDIREDVWECFFPGTKDPNDEAEVDPQARRDNNDGDKTNNEVRMESRLERSDSKSIVPPSYITKPLMSHSTHVHLPLVSSLLFQYTISITSETLGLTVENVLERTIIRTVIPNQSASLAGAQVGSLITMVGKRETRELTHFECIDELRQSKRPLSLTLRPVEENVLENGRR